MLPCFDDPNIVKIDLLPSDTHLCWHKSESQIHSFTNAFGGPESRLAMPIQGRTETVFYLQNGDPFDACIKLTGEWSDDKDAIRALDVGEEYHKEYSTPSIRITLNGEEVWSGVLHMPIVCAGWPSVYWKIRSGLLRSGRNYLTLETDGSLFLMNQNAIFMRIDSGDIAKPLFVPRVLTTGIEFSVTMTLYRDVADLSVEHDDSIELTRINDEYVIGENDFFFRATKPSCSPSLVFVIDGSRIAVDLPPILAIPVGLPCYVGIDSDDHRHDNTGMMSEILQYVFRSGIGDMVMFRPKPGRNCMYSPPAERCREWIEILRKFHAKYLLCNWEPVGDFPAELYPEMASDPNSVGCHAHEPYFMMFEPICSNRVRHASNFQERRDAYMDALKSWVNEQNSRGIDTACGEASWLAEYAASAGFNIINTEVVTGFGPQFAAVNGALRGRPLMSSGHHIAIDWYLGYPHDDLKSHRFRLMALLSYTHGAKYIYAENSLFYTNSYVRNDPEDRFVRDNRAIMAQLYDLTRVQPRFGEICTELAVAYGNLEGMLWFHDDRLPEADDAVTNWPDLVWNKWSGDSYKPAMRAVDAWLPPVRIERYHNNRSILKWFSYNPHGNVEMVSMERNADILKRYRILAFLGWNSMTDDVLQKLKDYVFNGGTLFIAGCHFDRRLSPDSDQRIDTTGAEELIGASVNGIGQFPAHALWQGREYGDFGELRLCDLELREAVPLIKDDNGSPILLQNGYGRGEVYFYNFWDHPATLNAIEMTKSIMSWLGNNSKGDFGMENGYGINCSNWYDANSDTRRLYLVNVNWETPRTSEMCSVRLWGEPFPVTVRHEEMTVVTISKNIAVIPDSANVFVDAISINGTEGRIRVVGSGRHSVRIISSVSYAIAMSSDETDSFFAREWTFSLDMKGSEELTFQVKRM